jgi:hypothetical protein
LLAGACVALAACSSLLELDQLQRVDCVERCGGTAGSTASSGAATSGGGGTLQPGAGASSGGVSTSGGTNQGGSGILPVQGGSAGDSGYVGPCPGGPTPPPTWKEHWDKHAEELTLRDYDACVAVYVDADMSGTDSAWLSAFLSQAWAYNLTTYGELGSERLYVVLHLDKFIGGRSSAFYETTHDGHNVIDVGANNWKAGDYDRVGTPLSELVASTAVPGKRGSPGAAQWGHWGFAQIYKYDLYSGLGMDAQATQAFDAFNPTVDTYPVPGSYWFADFYYPIWRDHGKARALVDFFGLLGQYYPATDQVMAPMTWGQYIHFMSGAAGVEVQTQATYAFGWNDGWEADLQKAKGDFPGITY